MNFKRKPSKIYCNAALSFWVDMTWVCSGVAPTVCFSDVLCCPSFIQHYRKQFPIPPCLLLSSVSRMMCLVVLMQNIKVSLTKRFLYLIHLLLHCWDTHVWKCLPPLHSYQPFVSCLFVIQHTRLHTYKHHLFALSPPPGMPVDVHSFRLWQIQNGSSFHGCIQNLYINNELQDFTKTQMKPGVVPGCEPCKKIYCVHGICQPDGVQGPVCHCQPGWSGPHCDQPATNPCQGSKYVNKWDKIYIVDPIIHCLLILQAAREEVLKSLFCRKMAYMTSMRMCRWHFTVEHVGPVVQLRV